MSFGFSVTDFVTCAQIAGQVYDVLKTGSAKCEAFAEECLQFHHILLKLTENVQNLQRKNQPINHPDVEVLDSLLQSCRRLINQEISPYLNETFVAKVNYQSITKVPTEDDYKCFRPEFTKWSSHKLREAKFVRQIPRLQNAVSRQIEKLTAFNTVLIQSSQQSVQKSQVKSETTQDLMIAKQDELQQSHVRIENKLQQILQLQHKKGDSLSSQCLDASSPEGRQTWMNLGRLLREEGITPSMIKKNQDALVKVMKTTCKDLSPGESATESNQTAPEYPQGSSSAPPSSIPLLSSAPPRDAHFPPSLLQKQSASASLLDERQNLDNGIESLLAGMETEVDKIDEDDDIFAITEELSDEAVAYMEQDFYDNRHRYLGYKRSSRSPYIREDEPPFYRGNPLYLPNLYFPFPSIRNTKIGDYPPTPSREVSFHNAGDAT